VVPALWRLSLVRRNRVFLERTLPQILGEILAEAGLDLAAPLPAGAVQPWFAQWEETDLDGFHRCCARAGLTYTLLQEGDGDRLLFLDRAGAGPLLPGEAPPPRESRSLERPDPQFEGASARPDLGAGRRLDLGGGRGTGLILEVEHVLEGAYGNRWRMQGASSPLPPCPASIPRIPGALPARILSSARRVRAGAALVQVAPPLPPSRRSPPGAWLPLVQPCGGEGHGLHVPPPEGEEVLVAFLDGHPDRPVVTGALVRQEPGAARQGLLRTDAGHGLLLEDGPGTLAVQGPGTVLRLGKRGAVSGTETDADGDLGMTVQGNRLDFAASRVAYDNESVTRASAGPVLNALGPASLRWCLSATRAFLGGQERWIRGTDFHRGLVHQLVQRKEIVTIPEDPGLARLLALQIGLLGALQAFVLLSAQDPELRNRCPMAGPLLLASLWVVAERRRAAARMKELPPAARIALEGEGGRLTLAAGGKDGPRLERGPQSIRLGFPGNEVVLQAEAQASTTRLACKDGSLDLVEGPDGISLALRQKEGDRGGLLALRPPSQAPDQAEVLMGVQGPGEAFRGGSLRVKGPLATLLATNGVQETRLECRPDGLSLAGPCAPGSCLYLSPATINLKQVRGGTFDEISSTHWTMLA
jgi:hypothetical protein